MVKNHFLGRFHVTLVVLILALTVPIGFAGVTQQGGGGVPAPVQISDTDVVGSYCETATVGTCGTFVVPSPMCVAEGNGTCVSSITGDYCAEAFWSWYTCTGTNCTGQCQNNPSESCSSGRIRTCF